MQLAGMTISKKASRNAILFYILLAGMCAWILALPLFPSQDGSAHKYYAWVVQQVLVGNAWITHAYGIRHPIPPYASQDVLLVGLAHIMSLDMADKIFVCLTVICTAVGTRFCCTWLGPGGSWMSLFVFPLLLNWSVLMGFMNYSLGVGLMLMLYACWMRAADGKRAYWIPYAVLAIILAFTHPLPLLVALGLCCCDFAVQLFSRMRHDIRLSLRALRPQMMGLLLLTLEMGYPLLHTSRKRTDQGILHSMFRFNAYLTDLTLDGVSPYERHSHAPLLLAYKILLYALLLLGLFVAAQGFRERWRQKQLDRCDWLLCGSILVYVTLPLTPDWINGAALGARLLIFSWFGMLLAASRFHPNESSKRWITVGALSAFLITMLPAQAYLRPAAQQVATLERMPLPAHKYGFMLVAGALPPIASKLGFDPWLWGPMLSMMHADDIPVNSPWLDQVYYVVKPENDMHLMFNMVPTAEARHKIDKHDGSVSFLTQRYQNLVLSKADFLIIEGIGADKTGRIGKLSSEQSAAFRCEASMDGMQLCPRVKENAAQNEGQ